MEKFAVDINVKSFKGNDKWSHRIKNTFLNSGSKWSDVVEKKVKGEIAEVVENYKGNIEEMIISEKSGFLNGLVSVIEEMISSGESV